MNRICVTKDERCLVAITLLSEKSDKQMLAVVWRRNSLDRSDTRDGASGAFQYLRDSLAAGNVAGRRLDLHQAADCLDSLFVPLINEAAHLCQISSINSGPHIFTEPLLARAANDPRARRGKIANRNSRGKSFVQHVSHY